MKLLPVEEGIPSIAFGACRVKNESKAPRHRRRYVVGGRGRSARSTTITSTGPLVDSRRSPSCSWSACEIDIPEMPEPGGGGGIAGVVSSGTKSSCRSKDAVNPVLSSTRGPSIAERVRTNSDMAIFPPRICAPLKLTETIAEPQRPLAGGSSPARPSSSADPFHGRVRRRVHARAVPRCLELGAASVRHERKHRQFLHLPMCLQLEAVFKQRLQHAKDLIAVCRGVGLGLDFIMIRRQPAWTALAPAVE